MSVLDRAEVERLARLAALTVPDGALHELADQVARILAFVSQLDQEVPAVDAAPTPGPAPRLRADRVEADPQAFDATRCAPAATDGLLLTPRVAPREP